MYLKQKKKRDKDVGKQSTKLTLRVINDGHPTFGAIFLLKAHFTLLKAVHNLISLRNCKSRDKSAEPPEVETKPEVDIMVPVWLV